MCVCIVLNLFFIWQYSSKKSIVRLYVYKFLYVWSTYIYTPVFYQNWKKWKKIETNTRYMPGVIHDWLCSHVSILHPFLVVYNMQIWQLTRAWLGNPYSVEPVGGRVVSDNRGILRVIRVLQTVRRASGWKFGGGGRRRGSGERIYES